MIIRGRCDGRLVVEAKLYMLPRFLTLLTPLKQIVSIPPPV
jgi:hypothetical protein